MKKVRIQINDLIDQHGETFGDCPGCSICSEIVRLRNVLLQNPAERFAHILKKGQDMTKSDIALLLENEVQRKVIQKSLNMSAGSFFEMMKNLGMLKKKPKNRGVEEEVAKSKLDLTVPEYIQLHHVEGIGYEEIAVMKGVKKEAIANWKWRNKAEVEKALKETKNKTTDKSSEYETLIADLKSKVLGHEIHIDKLEQVIEKYSNKEAEYEAALASKDERIMELEGSLAEAQAQIDYLNAACTDVEEEAGIQVESSGYFSKLQERISTLELELVAVRHLAYLKLKQDVGA